MVPTTFLKAHENQQLILEFQILEAKSKQLHPLQNPNSPPESKEETRCHLGLCCPAVSILAMLFLTWILRQALFIPGFFFRPHDWKGSRILPSTTVSPACPAWHWGRKPTRRVWLCFAAFGQWHQLLLQQFWHSKYYPGPKYPVNNMQTVSHGSRAIFWFSWYLIGR